MPRETINTNHAPAAIGTYSQAVKCGNTVYLSGQIPLVPATLVLVEGDLEAQLRQVFNNLQAVAVAAGGHLEQIVKLTVFLTDLQQFAQVNQVMSEYFPAPYPARAVVQVAALPCGASVEIDGILDLNV